MSATEDTAAWFRDQNEGYGLDVVFEMSGSSQAINDAFQVVRNGGRVVLFGIPSRPVEIDVAEALIFKNLSVLALNGRKVFDTWYKTRWMLERGVVDLSPLVTDELEGLDGINDALAQLQAGEACKIVVYPNGRPDPPTQPAQAAGDGGRTPTPARAELGAQVSGGLDADLQSELDELRAAGTYKEFLTLTSPQDAVVEMDGRGEVIVLSSNNYLGLADHPDVVSAGMDGLRRYGAGTGSVRFICGTFQPHHDLERALADFLGTEAALTTSRAGTPTRSDPFAHRRADGRSCRTPSTTPRSSTRSGWRGRARKVIYSHSDMAELRRSCARLHRASAS